MKILLIKPFDRRQDLQPLVDEVYKEDHVECELLDLYMVDYCMDDNVSVDNMRKFDMSSNTEERMTNNMSKTERLTYSKFEFTMLQDHWKMYLRFSEQYDIIVGMDSVDMSFEPDFLERLLAPFDNSDVQMTYCDFDIVHDGTRIPYFHQSAPSPLQNYPLFAFRGGIIKETAKNLPEIIAQQLLSIHIPHRLVTVNE